MVNSVLEIDSLLSTVLMYMVMKEHVSQFNSGNQWSFFLCFLDKMGAPWHTGLASACDTINSLLVLVLPRNLLALRKI